MATKTTRRQRALTKTTKKSKQLVPKRYSKGKKAKNKTKKKQIVYSKLPSAIAITKSAANLIWENRKFFIALTIVYGLLNLVLVQGLASSSSITSIKSELTQIFSGHLSGLASGLSIFAVLVSSAGNSSSPTAGAYQLFLGIVTSLAIIWSLRQLMSGHINIRVRDAYYKGMAPLIPFILVLIMIGIQIIPLLIGSLVYSTVISNGIAIGPIEIALFFILFLALALFSLYLVSSTLIAVYISTLPDMTPLLAYKSAKQLVKKRRWVVLRKILFLPLVLLIASSVIMMPIILLLTFLAQWVFFILTTFALVAVHTYMYALYRELLNEA